MQRVGVHTITEWHGYYNILYRKMKEKFIVSDALILWIALRTINFQNMDHEDYCFAFVLLAYLIADIYLRLKKRKENE